MPNHSSLHDLICRPVRDTGDYRLGRGRAWVHGRTEEIRRTINRIELNGEPHGEELD